MVLRGSTTSDGLMETPNAAIAASRPRHRKSPREIHDALQRADGWSVGARWPNHLTPPLTTRQALDADGPWGAAACGAVVRPCIERGKGWGAFAKRDIEEGALVGVYWGEPLTQHEHAVSSVTPTCYLFPLA